MEVSNIANNPVTFSLSGKNYLVKRLSLLDLFAEFEVMVKEQYMDDIAKMASRVKDSKERIDLQRALMKDMPKGRELQEIIHGVPGPKDKEGNDTMVGGLINSPEGFTKLLYLALSKCNKITDEEIKEIVSDQKTNAVAITNIMNYITGTDIEKKEENVPKNATIITTEKKT